MFAADCPLSLRELASRQAAGWLPVHRDQLRAQRSVSSMGSLYLYLYSTY